MLDGELNKLLATAREIGFMRGINHAADMASKAHHLDLAIAIRSQIFEADTFGLANKKVA
jgi:hypothetical protein